MNETWVTVVGNAATRPDFRETAAGVAVARFRLAVTVRRWDRRREIWADAYTSFYTVWTWRSLAANVAGSVSLGEPLLVHGTLRLRERERDRPREQSRDQQGDRTGRAGAEQVVPYRQEAEEYGGMRGAGGSGAGGAHRWITAEIDAVAVGHDLSRGTSAFRRVSQAKPLFNVPSGATSA
ncbi:single-stranded DNA-binding protein [Streptomyces sp. NA02950]|uniref:single-stranded DNA-binding protein n=1 Tax=Streptomyces sp. NA02950 TaxID=2742137 RepID=UPI00159071A9|nr:single-stranded DNA-binding protein [Streptomyces sp. NA02950]QKV97846.1 single-stranded DNA-binding protein [Streptomyces sp. NA02950]